MAGVGAAPQINRGANRWLRVLTLALFAALLGCVAHTVWFWFRTISFPFPVDYREGPLLEQAVRLGHGLSIYRIPASEPPWLIGELPAALSVAEQSVGAALRSGVLVWPDDVRRQCGRRGAVRRSTPWTT
jgi:hypothetical protein